MILVDTTPLVAICDARDSRHDTAVKHLTRLVAGELCVCEAVLVEACFHLPYRAQRDRLQAALDEFHFGCLPTQEAGFWTDVFRWLAKYADQEPEWTDGCIAVLSGRHERLRVWTYDREFRTTWRRLDGKAIPMAV